MIGYGSGILERPSHSQARMGRGSPLCETHGCIKDINTLAQEHFVKQLTQLTQFLMQYAYSNNVLFGVLEPPGPLKIHSTSFYYLDTEDCFAFNSSLKMRKHNGFSRSVSLLRWHYPSQIPNKSILISSYWCLKSLFVLDLTPEIDPKQVASLHWQH